MSTVTISTTGNNLQVASPYHPDFPARARALGGKWVATSKAWSFDPRDEPAVRALCVEFFGTDGSPVMEGDLVTLRVTLAPNIRIGKLCGPLYFAGREIGRAYGRDSGARQGDGIVFLKGSVTSGGSMKNWYTKTTEGAIFEIRDLPRAKAEETIKDSGYDDGDIERIEIVSDDTDHDTRRRALETERAALLARLAEIDSELGNVAETPEPTEPTTSEPTPRAGLIARVANLAMATGTSAAALLVAIQVAAYQLTQPGQLELAI